MKHQINRNQFVHKISQVGHQPVLFDFQRPPFSTPGHGREMGRTDATARQNIPGKPVRPIVDDTNLLILHSPYGRQPLAFPNLLPYVPFDVIITGSNTRSNNNEERRTRLKTRLVKDLMVPLSEYATVSEDATLTDAVVALKKSQADFDPAKYRHRAILILDTNQRIVGKVNLQAILRALEPKYEDMLSDSGPMHMGFTRKYQKAIFESLKLWQDPMDQVCEKAARIKVKTFMVTPKESEMIEPDSPLSEAVHQLVLGHHQSLLVTKGKQVVGVLRLTDAFEVISDAILACDA
jgi:CBS domain-containing protein